jgi:hypothetical protein
MRGSYSGNTLAFQAKARSSILLPRSMVDLLRLVCKSFRPFGSVVEHSLGKGEVAGPIPAKGTSYVRRWCVGFGGCAVFYCLNSLLFGV